MGNYAGTRSAIEVTLGSANLSDTSSYSMKLDPTSYTFSNAAVATPTVTVTDLSTNAALSSDCYDVSVYAEGSNEPLAANPSEPGTYEVRAYGVGSKGYRGYASASFTIATADLSKATFAVDDITYRAGLVASPAMTATYNGYTLENGVDYSVAFSFTSPTTGNTVTGLENLEAPDSEKGNYKVTATFTALDGGRFTAGTTATATFYVISASKSLSEYGYVTLTNGKSYTLVSSGVRPDVVVTYKLDGGEAETLTKGIDYLLSYRNNKQAGKAYVTAIGIGDYSGSIFTTFTITSTLSSTLSAAGTGTKLAASSVSLQSAASTGDTSSTSSTGSALTLQSTSRGLVAGTLADDDAAQDALASEAAASEDASSDASEEAESASAASILASVASMVADALESDDASEDGSGSGDDAEGSVVGYAYETIMAALEEAAA